MNALFDTMTSGHICITLLHSLWQMAMAVVVAKAIGSLAPRRLNVRYVICVMALSVGLLSLPITYLRVSSSPLKTNVAAHVGPATSVDPKSGGDEFKPAAIQKIDPATAQTEDDRDGSETATTVQDVSPSVLASARTWWPAITVCVAMAYVAGVILMLARLARAAFRVEKIRASAQQVVTDSLLKIAEECCQRISLTVVPRIAHSSRVAIPKVVGLIRPTILLPTSAITGLTLSDLEMILAHELSHVRRHDLWVNCVQRLAESLLFFNPAAWYLSREIGMLREFCCDEKACAAVKGRVRQPRLRYAEALLNTLELSQQELDRSSVALAISGQGPSEIRKRIARLIDEPIDENFRHTRASVIVIAVALAILFAIPPFATSQEQRDAPGELLTGEVAPEIPPYVNASPFIPDAADVTVAAARKRTFGIQGVQKIAFKQTYRQAEVSLMQDHPDNSLESLWKARNGRFDKEQYSPHEVILAWDEDSLLLQNLVKGEPNKMWSQAKFWDGKEGWIGEYGSGVKNAYRYADISKLFSYIVPLHYPHWDAAGGRLPWNGPKVLLRKYGNAPAVTDYSFSATQIVDGGECEIFDGPARGEKLWITKSTGLVKAVSRHFANCSNEERLAFCSKICGKELTDIQEFTVWQKAQSAEAQKDLSVRWAEESWRYAEPGNLSVFSDYREIAPGVKWPMKVDRIIVHSNGNRTEGDSSSFKYYYGKIECSEVQREFSMPNLAKAALPEAGLKVTDRRHEVPVEYKWTENFDEGEAKRLLKLKLAEKRKQDAATQTINDTPINSIEDALEVLSEGPTVAPAKVWARAIKYLVDHRNAAVPALIEALDREKRDHPISKFAFALRAIGDRRAVPALIRSIPKTLLPGRSDYGLLIEDDALGPFLQRHDLEDAAGASSGAWPFGYGRAQREVFGALQRLTGQKFDEFELRFVDLSGTDSQRQQKGRQFSSVALQWQNWWERDWKSMLNDPAYSKVGLPLDDSPRNAAPTGQHQLPVGKALKFQSTGFGGIIQLVSESDAVCCFIDLDTGRTSGWPKAIPDRGNLSSTELKNWVKRKGFDVVGVMHTPKGEQNPRYCAQPLDMQTWKISEEELRQLGTAVSGETSYPLSRPVKLMVPRTSIPKPHDIDHSGDAFLFVTREGTSGVLRLTAQVTEIGSAGYSGANGSFENRGFYSGVKYMLSTIAKRKSVEP